MLDFDTFAEQYMKDQQNTAEPPSPAMDFDTFVKSKLSGESDVPPASAPETTPTAAPAPESEPAQEYDIDAIIDEKSKEYGLDPNLTRAIIWQESKGNPEAVSPQGAKGLMQLMDPTAADMGVADPFDPAQNIEGGIKYFRLMLDKYGGDPQLALAAYNAGPGNVDQYGGVPPFKETMNYIPSVLNKYQELSGEKPKQEESRFSLVDFVESPEFDVFAQQYLKERGIEVPPEEGEEQGYFSQLGRGVARGLYAVPETFAHATKALSPFESIDNAADSALQFLDEYEQSSDLLKDKEKGDEGLLSQGAEIVSQSLGVGVPGAIVGGLAGSFFGPVGTLAGAYLGKMISAAPIFGLAEYQQFMDQAEKKGIKEEDAEPYAILSGAFETGGEFLSDLAFGVGSGVLKPLTKPGKEALKVGLTTLFKGGWKQALGMGAMGMATETGGEMATAAGQTYAGRKAGLGGASMWQAATDVIGPSAVASIMFSGIFGAAGLHQKNVLRKALSNPETDTKTRLGAADQVYNTIAEVDPDIADVWRGNAYQAIQEGVEIPLEEDVTELQAAASEYPGGEGEQPRAFTDWMKEKPATSGGGEPEQAQPSPTALLEAPRIGIEDTRGQLRPEDIDNLHRRFQANISQIKSPQELAALSEDLRDASNILGEGRTRMLVAQLSDKAKRMGDMEALAQQPPALPPAQGFETRPAPETQLRKGPRPYTAAQEYPFEREERIHIPEKIKNVGLAKAWLKKKGQDPDNFDIAQTPKGFEARIKTQPEQPARQPEAETYGPYEDRNRADTLIKERNLQDTHEPVETPEGWIVRPVGEAVELQQQPEITIDESGRPMITVTPPGAAPEMPMPEEGVPSASEIRSDQEELQEVPPQGVVEEGERGGEPDLYRIGGEERQQSQVEGGEETAPREEVEPEEPQPAPPTYVTRNGKTYAEFGNQADAEAYAKQTGGEYTYDLLNNVHRVEEPTAAAETEQGGTEPGDLGEVYKQARKNLKDRGYGKKKIEQNLDAEVRQLLEERQAETEAKGILAEERGREKAYEADIKNRQDLAAKYPRNNAQVDSILQGDSAQIAKDIERGRIDVDTVQSIVGDAKQSGLIPESGYAKWDKVLQPEPESEAVEKKAKKKEKPEQVTTRKLIPNSDLDTDQLVQRIKAQFPNEDAQSLYGRFVSARDLKPEIGAKDFSEIFKRVGPNLYEETKTDTFNPTHKDEVTGALVQATPKEDNKGYSLIFENGMTGGEPGELPERFVPLDKSELTKQPPKIIETEQGPRPQKEVDTETAEQLRKDLEERRTREKEQKPRGEVRPEPGVAASRLTENTLLNDETMGEIVDRIVERKGIKNELKSVLTQRIETEGDKGFATWQDWMNPQKLSARVYSKLREQGTNHTDAKRIANNRILEYNQKFLQTKKQYQDGKLNIEPVEPKAVRSEPTPATAKRKPVASKPAETPTIESISAKSEYAEVKNKDNIVKMVRKFPDVEAAKKAYRQDTASHGFAREVADLVFGEDVSPKTEQSPTQMSDDELQTEFEKVSKQYNFLQDKRGPGGIGQTEETKPLWDRLSALRKEINDRKAPEIKADFEKKRAEQEAANKKRQAEYEKRVADAPVFRRVNDWEIVKLDGLYVVRDPFTKEDIYKGSTFKKASEVAKEAKPEQPKGTVEAEAEKKEEKPGRPHPDQTARAEKPEPAGKSYRGEGFTRTNGEYYLDSGWKNNLVNAIDDAMQRVAKEKGVNLDNDIEVTFSKPRTYNGNREIDATTKSGDRRLLLEKSQHNATEWDVIYKDGEEDIVLASNLPLRDAKRFAEDKIRFNEYKENGKNDSTVKFNFHTGKGGITAQNNLTALNELKRRVARSKDVQYSLPQSAQNLRASLTPQISSLKYPVRIVQSVTDLPGKGHPENVRGAVIKDTGYVVADNIADTEEARFVIEHEIPGHIGTRKVLGPKYDTFFNGLALAHKKDIADYQKSYAGRAKALGLSPREARTLAAEEWFADQVASGNYKSGKVKQWWDRFVRLFNEGLRDLGFTKNLSESEIADIAGRARKAVFDKAKRQGVNPFALMAQGGYSTKKKGKSDAVLFGNAKRTEADILKGRNGRIKTLESGLMGLAGEEARGSVEAVPTTTKEQKAVERAAKAFGLDTIYSRSGKGDITTGEAGKPEGGVDQIAYHSSPNVFDEYSSEHFGTGEGRFVFGYGAYLSGNSEVAEHYKKSTPTDRTNRLFNAVESFIRSRKGQRYELGGLRFYGNESPYDLIELINGGQITREDFNKRSLIYKNWPPENKGGHLYKIKIPSDERLMTWDGTLNEQPSSIKQILLKETKDSGSPLYGLTKSDLSKTESIGVQGKDGKIRAVDRGYAGRMIYQKLMTSFNGRTATKAKKASEYLASIGIPGHKYLTHEGRLLDIQENTENPYNYVIYDAKALNVIERDGESISPNRTGEPGSPSGDERITPTPSNLKSVSALKNGESVKISNRTITKIGDSYRVNYRSKHGNTYSMFPDIDSATLFAEEKILGLHFQNPEITSVEIPIRKDAKYRGQDEPWTERLTKTEILESPIIGFHFSSQDIKAFRPKQTAFYRRFPELAGFGFYATDSSYAVVVPKGTKTEFYDDDEFRVNLSSPGVKIYKVKPGWLPIENYILPHERVTTRPYNQGPEEPSPNRTSSPEGGEQEFAQPAQVSLAKAKEKITDNPAFVKWFGKSKVVDENGEPLVAYQGFPYDPGNIYKLGLHNASIRNEDQPNKFGFFFTFDKSDAERYSIENPNRPVIGTVKEVFLKIEKPLDLTKLGAYGGENLQNAFNKAKIKYKLQDEHEEEIWQHFLNEDGTKLRKAIQKAGYDGIIFKEEHGYDEYTNAVVFSPIQIKSIYNQGTFDTKNPDIRYSLKDTIFDRKPRKTENVPQALKEARAKIGKVESSFTEKLDEKLDRWWLKAKQGTFDQFAVLDESDKLAGIKDYADRSYVAARMTTSPAGWVHAMMEHGPLEWDNEGGWNVRRDGKSLVDILRPLGKNVADFLDWRVGNRAARLMKEGRENLFTPKDIKALQALGKGKEKAFAKADREIAQFNKEILDFAEKAGVIDPVTRKMWERADYIPFYRISEEDLAKGPRGKKGIASQYSGISTLKGGESNIGDPLTNMLMNYTHLVNAAVKNHATDLAIESLKKNGAVSKAASQFKPALVPDSQVKKVLKKQYGEILESMGIDLSLLDIEQAKGIHRMFQVQKPQGKDIIHVLKNGKPEYYHVYDPLALKALTNINQNSWNDPIMKTMRSLKRVFTRGVTADPAFMISNIMRDTLHAWVVSSDKFVPVIDSAKGFLNTIRKDENYISMLATGASFEGGYTLGHDPSAAKQLMKKMLNDHNISEESILDTPKKLWHWYEKYGNAFENATRHSIYSNLRKEGKTHLEASYRAKDIMDYSMRGDWAVMRFLTETVPFFGARLQGLYRLGRGVNENPKAFATKGAMLMLGALALYGMNKDDERFKELEGWDRDQYFHFFMPDGNHYRLPKPFEVGLIFGTMPERITEFLFTGDLELLGDRVLAGFRDTLAWQPPQLVGPIIEQYANKSFFTGRPIVGMALERLQPGAQRQPWTSETLSQLGQTIDVSPKRMEHLVRAYFGTLGMYVLSASDIMTRHLWDYPNPPASRLDDMPVIKRFVRDTPARNTKYVTAMYEMAKEVDAINSTINHYRKNGMLEEARDLRRNEYGRLKKRKMLMVARRRLGKINNRIRFIHQSNLTPDQKRMKIDKLTERRNKIAESIYKKTKDAF